jgi:hypothetical protein
MRRNSILKIPGKAQIHFNMPRYETISLLLIQMFHVSSLTSFILFYLKYRHREENSHIFFWIGTTYVRVLNFYYCINFASFIYLKAFILPGMVGHNCNPSAWEAGAGGSWAWATLGKFKTSLELHNENMSQKTRAGDVAQWQIASWACCEATAHTEPQKGK